MNSPATDRSGIYKIVNVTNGNSYIGSAINLSSRFVQHKSMLLTKTHHSIHLQRAYNKYGRKNFKYIVILICDSNMLLWFEQLFLDTGCGYYNINLMAASRLGSEMNTEQRKRLSEAHKGYIPTEIQKIKIGKATKRSWLNPEYRERCTVKKGRDNHFYGQKHSKLSLKKMSEKLRSKWQEPEFRKKLIEAAKRRPCNRKGVKLSKEVKAKMSLAKRNMSEETKKRMSLAHLTESYQKNRYKGKSCNLPQQI